jgi:hypothetical protein
MKGDMSFEGVQVRVSRPNPTKQRPYRPLMRSTQRRQFLAPLSAALVVIGGNQVEHCPAS